MNRMSIVGMGLSLVLGLVGCKGKQGEPEGEPEAKAEVAPQAQNDAANAPKPASTANRSGIVWIHNDYKKAISLAREQSKPLVIDMWAGWCHTCLAMKKGTLADPGLAEIADDVIWLAIDTEDPSSADVMAKFPPKVWPTFFVVSPADETVQASQLGSCSVGDFREFVDRGSRAHREALEAGGKLAPGSALAYLRDGDRAWMDNEYQAAADAYAAARKAGGDGWRPKAQSLKNQLAALHKLEDKKDCAALATRELTFMAEQHSSSGVDFIYFAASCAGALGEAEANVLRARSLAALRGIIDDAQASLSADDRSDALASARGIALELGDTGLATSLAREQQALLATAVAAATTPLEEMTYVWHQVEVHAYLGLGEDILPWVQQLEAKLPTEYDPPYRQAWLLLSMKRYAEAHAAVQRALPLSSGARRGRILGLDASIYKAEGKTAKEREVRMAVVAHFEDLAEGLASDAKLTSAKKALAEMDAPAP
tara:strand:+ start:33876 stop:35330 length:1455 start_codon:yes stop_codon:yes gene_type:complete